MYDLPGELLAETVFLPCTTCGRSETARPGANPDNRVVLRYVYHSIQDAPKVETDPYCTHCLDPDTKHRILSGLRKKGRTAERAQHGHTGTKQRKHEHRGRNDLPHTPANAAADAEATRHILEQRGLAVDRSADGPDHAQTLFDMPDDRDRERKADQSLNADGSRKRPSKPRKRGTK